MPRWTSRHRAARQRHLDLARRSVAVGARAVERGGCADGGRADALDIAARGEPLGRERLVAGAVGIGAGIFGIGRTDVGLHRAHPGDGEFAVGAERCKRGARIGDAGGRIGQIGLSGGDARVEVAHVDPHQRLARMHQLIVLHQHVGHQPAHLGGDGAAVRLHIGIVGGFADARREQPGDAGDGDQHGDDAGDQRIARDAEPPLGGGRLDMDHGRSVHWDITSRVEVADAIRRPSESVSLASAKATRRPNESRVPTARTLPVAGVIAR